MIAIDITELARQSQHGPYQEYVLAYLIFKHVPGMKLVLTKEEYEATMKDVHLDIQCTLSDDEDSYTVELLPHVEAGEVGDNHD